MHASILRTPYLIPSSLSTGPKDSLIRNNGSRMVNNRGPSLHVLLPYSPPVIYYRLYSIHFIEIHNQHPSPSYPPLPALHNLLHSLPNRCQLWGVCKSLHSPTFLANSECGILGTRSGLGTDGSGESCIVHCLVAWWVVIPTYSLFLSLFGLCCDGEGCYFFFLSSWLWLSWLWCLWMQMYIWLHSLLDTSVYLWVDMSSCCCNLVWLCLSGCQYWVFWFGWLLGFLWILCLAVLLVLLQEVASYIYFWNVILLISFYSVKARIISEFSIFACTTLQRCFLPSLELYCCLSNSDYSSFFNFSSFSLSPFSLILISIDCN